MREKPITIRPALAADAEAILRVHHSAVHETAAGDYAPEILAEWSAPVNAARIEAYVNKALPAELTFVAERNGEIAGFGAIVPAANELRAVYVAASHSGAGVGSALLAALEHSAKEAGCPFLEMDSSLTAERFYRRHGFKVLSRGTHPLSTGQEMACVRMKKELR